MMAIGAEAMGFSVVRFDKPGIRQLESQTCRFFNNTIFDL
jgi:hypothetical protein